MPVLSKAGEQGDALCGLLTGRITVDLAQGVAAADANALAPRLARARELERALHYLDESAIFPRTAAC